MKPPVPISFSSRDYLTSSESQVVQGVNGMETNFMP